MIKGVFFDFYGTLVGWEPAGEQVQATAALDEGITVDPAAVNLAYPVANAYLDQENAKQPITARSSLEAEKVLVEYERRLLSAAGVIVPLAVASRIWRRVDRAPKKLAAYPEARRALEVTRSAGLITGVISNMGFDLPNIVNSSGLGGLADAVVSSAEAGVSKPHAPIFLAALAKAGLRPFEAVHVGDSYDGDVLGALGAGMRAIWLSRRIGPATTHKQQMPKGVGLVHTLDEVLPYLRSEGLFT